MHGRPCRLWAVSLITLRGRTNWQQTCVWCDCSVGAGCDDQMSPLTFWFANRYRFSRPSDQAVHCPQVTVNSGDEHRGFSGQRVVSCFVLSGEGMCPIKCPYILHQIIVFVIIIYLQIALPICSAEWLEANRSYTTLRYCHCRSKSAVKCVFIEMKPYSTCTVSRYYLLYKVFKKLSITWMVRQNIAVGLLNWSWERFVS